MFEWFKKLVKYLLRRFVNWLSKKIYKPRLWTDKEWKQKNPKEKVWIWYKHHDALIGSGNGELDKVLPFLTGEFLTTTAAISVFIKMFGLPEWFYFLYPAFYIGYKYVQWWIGNEIDKRDFPALTSEIGSKRTTAFRELRKAANNEEWRKKVH